MNFTVFSFVMADSDPEVDSRDARRSSHRHFFVFSHLIMQRQFQHFVEFFVPLVQFLDIPAADLDTHSTYLQQTVEISQVTVLGCGRACCFAKTGALVGSCRKLWSFRSCSFGFVQFLDKVVVPVGATTGGRAMLSLTMDTCYASSRVAFGRIF